jgi:hypothetical protein
MVAGAQAVWLLSPDERPERLDRPEGLAKDSHWNRKQWAEGLDGAHPGAIEPGSLAEATRTLRDLVGAKKKAEVFQTRVIRQAAERVYNAPPDPRVVAECVAEWRAMSGVAHAMPWEQSTRPDGVSTEHDGVRTILHAASWLQLQSGLGSLTRSWKPAGACSTCVVPPRPDIAPRRACP